MLDAHNGQVWRVSWNVTGTMLATSGADASVKLWTGDSSQTATWQCATTVRPSDPHVKQPTAANEPKQRDAFY